MQPFSLSTGGPRNLGPILFSHLTWESGPVGSREKGVCVGCSHGGDTGLGGASWGHMECRDEECA